MEILFMGTGAADWNIKDRKLGEFHRRLTSIKINDDLIIDFNDETPDFIEMNHSDIEKVKNILITHTHSDHFSVSAINKNFGKNINVWLEGASFGMAADIECNIKEMPLRSEIKIGKYSVTAVEANHSVNDINEKPINYIVSDGEKTVFWGCDGAWIPNLSWHEIRKHKYDAVILDGTLNDTPGDYRIFEHNNLNMIKEMCLTFKSQGLMKENSKIMISHMSKFSQYPHEELENILKPHNIQPAYDGLLLKL